MILGEFLTKIGVISDKKEVREFTSSLRDMTSSAFTGTLALAGISFSVGKMITDTLDLASSLGTFNAETGASIETLQRWEQAGKQLGLSNGVVRSSIIGVMDSMARLNNLGDWSVAMAAARLGINLSGKSGKDIEEVLDEFAQAYKTKDPNTFRLWAGQLGVSPEMTRFFQMSQQGRAHLLNTAPVLTDSDQKAMMELQAELARFSTTVSRDFVPVLRLWLPYLEELSKSVTYYLGNAGKNWKTVTDYANKESPGIGHGPVAFYTGVTDMAYRWFQGMNRYQPGGDQQRLDAETQLVLHRIVEGLELLANDGRPTGGMKVEQHFHDVHNAKGVEEAGKVGARELEHVAKNLGGQGK